MIRRHQPVSFESQHADTLFAGVDGTLILQNRRRGLVSHIRALDPQGRFHSIWDGLVFACVVLSAFWDPYNVAYWRPTYPEYNAWWETPIDILFWVDIGVNFTTAYDTGYKMETSLARIAARYARGWFLLDVLSNLPYATMVEQNNYAILLPMLKVVRIARVSRLVSRLTMSINIHSALVEAAVFFLYVLVVGHVLACCFWIMPEFSGNAFLSWKANHIEKPVSEQYLLCIYWAVTTMTTIGYGDVTPHTQEETILVIFAELLGLIVFAIMISQINTLYAALRVDKTTHNAYKDNVVEFIKNAAIDQEEKEELMLKSREFLRFKRKSNFHGFSDNDPRFECLSYTLRDEIRQGIFLPALMQIKMFGGDSEEKEKLDSLLDQFDTDDVKGFLDEEEFKLLLTEMGGKFTTKDAREAMKQMGLNENGMVSTISFYQWYHLYKHKMPAMHWPDPFLSQLASRLRVLAYSDGDVLVHPGQYGKRFYILLKGQVSVFQREPINVGKVGRKVMTAMHSVGAQNGLASLASEKTPKKNFALDPPKSALESSVSFTEYGAEKPTRVISCDDRYPVFGVIAGLGPKSHKLMRDKTRRWVVTVSNENKLTHSPTICDVCSISYYEFQKALESTWEGGQEKIALFASYYYDTDLLNMDIGQAKDVGLIETHVQEIDRLRAKLKHALEEFEDSTKIMTSCKTTETFVETVETEVEKMFDVCQVSTQLTEVRLHRLEESIRQIAHQVGKR